MPSVTNYITKEHSIADTGSQNMGTAKDDHAPVGYSGSWVYRELMRFASSGPPSGAKIVSCILHLKTTSGTHFQHGSSPRILIHRLTSDFAAEGGGTETWRTDANPVWSGPSATSSGEVDSAFGNADQYVRTFNITDIYEAICSAGYFKRDGTPAGGNTNHGIRLRAYSEGSTADRVEFYSMRGSYVPRVVITWTVPDEATQPDLVAPASGILAAAPTQFSFLFPSGDGAEDYELEVGTALDTNNLWNPAVAAVTPGTQKNVTYAGTALPTDGSTIYWRVRGRNEVGTYGPWAHSSFSVQSVPVATLSSSIMVEVWNLDALAAWASAEGKARIKALYAHPQNLDAAAWEVEVNGVVTAFPGGTKPGGTATFDLATGWTRNTNYSVRVRAQGTAGQWSAWTAAANLRINWAQGIYTFTHGAGATNVTARHSALTTDATKTKVAYLYRNSPSGPWTASLTAAAVGTAVDMLVRLSSFDPAINPTLPTAKVEWSAAGTGGSLDFWAATGAGNSIIPDANRRRFGVHSSKYTAAVAGYLQSNRGVPMTGDTDYTMSAYIHTGGVALVGNIYLILKSENAATEVGRAPANTTGHVGAGFNSVGKGADDWYRMYWTFRTPGSKDDTLLLRPGMVIGAGNAFWVDAFQYEEGNVATGWKPGMAGPAVVVDVGGIAVDGPSGGILRLMGGAGGVRDLVEMSPHGLLFAGDAELHSPLVDTLQVGDGTSSNPVEFISAYPKASGGQFRTISGAGGYGFIIRQDGSRVYFLLTNLADPYGIYNALRPFYIDNATGVVTLGTGATVNGVPIGGANRVVLTASNAAWPKPVCSWMDVEVIGGGGAGGGTNTTSTGEQAAAGGGGGGGYIRKMYSGAALAALPATINVIVGTGGVSTNAATAPNGVDSVFNSGGAGVVLTGVKGLGGARGANTTGNLTAAGGEGGTGTQSSGTDGIVVKGGWGGAGRVSGGTAVFTGVGGGTPLGNGGKVSTVPAEMHASPYGAGGGGLVQGQGNATAAGGNGSAGVVIVTYG